MQEPDGYITQNHLCDMVIPGQSNCIAQMCNMRTWSQKSWIHWCFSPVYLGGMLPSLYLIPAKMAASHDINHSHKKRMESKGFSPGADGKQSLKIVANESVYLALKSRIFVLESDSRAYN